MVPATKHACAKTSQTKATLYSCCLPVVSAYKYTNNYSLFTLPGHKFMATGALKGDSYSKYKTLLTCMMLQLCMWCTDYSGNFLVQVCIRKAPFFFEYLPSLVSPAMGRAWSMFTSLVEWRYNVGVCYV